MPHGGALGYLSVEAGLALWCCAPGCAFSLICSAACGVRDDALFCGLHDSFTMFASSLVDWSYRACVKIVAPRPSSMPLPQQAGARLVRLVQGTVGMQAQRSVQRTWLRSQLPHPASGVGCCGRALYLNSRGILARCVHGCGTGLGAVLKRHASWEANRRTGMLFWIGHRANMGLVRAKLLQDRHRHSQLACLLALLLGC